MKRTIALILSVMLVLALFAGCGGNTNTGSTGTNTGKTDAGTNTGKTDTNTDKGNTDSGSTGTDAEAGTDADSPYNLAAGKYEVDENGYPYTRYEYELPLTTADEVFTKWTTCYTPQYLPEEGFAGIETWMQLAEMTGVHIEYDIIAAANRDQNFSVLLASDALDDILDNGNVYYKGGTMKDAIADGYFANFYDYIDYLPNYMYMIKYYGENNINVRARVFYDDTTIPALYGMVTKPCAAQGYFLRQDWMDKLGLGNAIDVKTYDQLHEVLTAMKVGYRDDKEIFPLFINNNGEVYQAALFGGYDTTIYTSSLMYPRVVDGVVDFCGVTEDDRAAMTLLSTWYSERLISPQFQSFVAGGDYDCGAYTDELGCHLLTPSSWDNAEAMSENPDTDWEPIPRTKKTEDQVMKYGFAKARDCFSYSSVCINANCSNIALVTSWIDFGFSEFGSDYVSYGPQGILWDYDENGQRMLTDFALNHEAGTSWILFIYGTNGFVDCALMDNTRDLSYPGGERCLYAYDVFNLPDYKGEYDWPSAVSFTDEEREENSSVTTDLNTYFTENYTAFMTGDRPMSTWDEYIEGMYSFGYETLRENYQAAYERFMAKYA